MFDNPQQVLELWVNGINARKLNEVVDLYDENAVLIPTFSIKCLHNLDAIRSYFEKLFRYKDLHAVLHDETLCVQRLSPALYSMSGTYYWRLKDEDAGEVSGVEARFTFTINIKHAKPIIHHHSSSLFQKFEK